MSAAEDNPDSKPLNIGAVVDLLKDEFPDLSISKVRYLEEMRLISPKRSPGGYRKFGKADVERLRTILTLQRDEFMPLKVIRRELSRRKATAIRPGGSRSFRKVKLAAGPGKERSFTLEAALETAGIDEGTARELEEYGLVSGRSSGGVKRYDELEVEIMAAAAELSRYGVEARNLKTLKSSVDRESALLLQILSPALKSRNTQSRKNGVKALENLATVSTHLKYLLLVQELRRFIS